jgi:hypothetical protein
MDWVLKLFGYRREYVCDWGVFDSRYDSTDYHMNRPIHPQMSVAPPWAKTRLAPINPERGGR